MLSFIMLSVAAIAFLFGLWSILPLWIKIVIIAIIVLAIISKFQS